MNVQDVVRSTKKMKTRKSSICAICGVRPAATDDHIPPRGIFPRPRPSDLITVPACRECNKSTSDLDEVFKVMIAAQSGHGDEGRRLFEEQTTRTLEHNRRLKRDIKKTVRDVWIKSPAGIVLGKRPAILLDNVAHDTIIEKTVRGLHFHHTGAILGDNVAIAIHWHRQLSLKMYEMSVLWPTGSMGGNQLIYKFLLHPEVPFAGMWIFQFFGSAWSSGVVTPKQA